jgi:hypothetical protein
MTNQEQDNFLAAECVKRILHELRELDAIPSAPISLGLVATLSGEVRQWRAILAGRLTVRALPHNQYQIVSATETIDGGSFEPVTHPLVGPQSDPSDSVLKRDLEDEGPSF